MEKLLSTEIQNYINANLDADLHSLLLKKSPFDGVSMQEIVQQIKGRKVAEKKFPFLKKDNIIFPPNLNLEQASSEVTAAYKSEFLKGKNFLDLTCGFGIDAYFLSKNFAEIDLVEQNPELIKIVEHNWDILGRKANFHNLDLEDFLSQNKKYFDVIYLDPARRDQNLKKKFLLEDLSPNILEIQNQLLEIGDKIIIKLSPLIDISYLVSEVKHLSKIEIIAWRNDVKELVLTLEKNFISGNPLISCINLESKDSNFEFYFDDEKSIKADFGEVEDYLYIPNNAVLKSGGFNSISKLFKLKKLHPNTHLYTSSELLNSFSGRILKVENIDPKKLIKNEKFNIISKNHPLTPDEIKKKYKIKDGGQDYLVFTQSQKAKLVLRSLD